MKLFLIVLVAWPLLLLSSACQPVAKIRSLFSSGDGEAKQSRVAEIPTQNPKMLVSDAADFAPKNSFVDLCLAYAGNPSDFLKTKILSEIHSTAFERVAAGELKRCLNRFQAALEGDSGPVEVLVELFVARPNILQEEYEMLFNIAFESHAKFMVEQMATKLKYNCSFINFVDANFTERREEIIAKRKELVEELKPLYTSESDAGLMLADCQKQFTIAPETDILGQ